MTARIRPGRPSVRRLATTALVVMAVLFASVAAHAADLGGAKIVGASCTKPFQQSYASEALRVFEVHPLDSSWARLEVTHTDNVAAGTRRYEVRWSIAPGMQLCENRAKFGYGTDYIKLGRSGSTSVELKARSPVRVKISARFPGKVRLRRDLGTSRRRALITRWARRGCKLESSNPGAADLLQSVADRGHAHGCKGPGKSSIPAATKLLRHVSAYFNNNSRSSDRTEPHAMAREYYRILRQLTRGTPATPPR